MASGNPVSINFTPSVDCQLELTVAFEAGSAGSDWGANVGCYLFSQQAAFQRTADQPLPQVRGRVTMLYVFSLVGGQNCTAGLTGFCNGATSVTFQNLEFRATLVKR